MAAELGGAHGWCDGGVGPSVRASNLGTRLTRVDVFRQIVQRERLLGYPITERLELCHLGAQFLVVTHLARRHVDLEHLAGPQAAAHEDVRGVDLDGPHLGGQQEAVVARHVVARRAQAVAVQRRPQRPPVGERDGGRTVPGLHEHGLVRVVGAPFG